MTENGGGDQLYFECHFNYCVYLSHLLEMYFLLSLYTLIFSTCPEDNSGDCRNNIIILDREFICMRIVQGELALLPVRY